MDDRQELTPTIGLHIRIPEDVSKELTRNVRSMGVSKNSAVMEGIRLWNKMAKVELSKGSGDQKIG